MVIAFAGTCAKEHGSSDRERSGAISNESEEHGGVLTVLVGLGRASKRRWAAPVLWVEPQHRRIAVAPTDGSTSMEPTSLQPRKMAYLKGSRREPPGLVKHSSEAKEAPGIGLRQVLP